MVDGSSVAQLSSILFSLSKEVTLDVEVRLRFIEVDNELVDLEDALQEELAGIIWLQSVRLDEEPSGVVTILVLETGPLLELMVDELEVELLDSD